MKNSKKADILKDIHKRWKVENLKQGEGYFIIFSSFKNSNKLAEISGGALKLYIYLGLHINNYDGYCYVTIKTMSEYFKKDARTISYWIKELEKLELISRLQFELNSPSYTYFKPY